MPFYQVKNNDTHLSDIEINECSLGHKLSMKNELFKVKDIIHLPDSDQYDAILQVKRTSERTPGIVLPN